MKKEFTNKEWSSEKIPYKQKYIDHIKIESQEVVAKRFDQILKQAEAVSKRDPSLTMQQALDWAIVHVKGSQ